MSIRQSPEAKRITPGLVTEALNELPDRIRIGAYPMKLVIIDGRARERHMVWGLFAADEQAIYLNDEFPTLTHMASTLIHEVMHAIWYAQGLEEAEDNEERIVTLMSSGFTQVLRDNAWFAPWIEKSFRFDRPIHFSETPVTMKHPIISATPPASKSESRRAAAASRKRPAKAGKRS